VETAGDWSSYAAAEGVYYYNIATQTSSWERPSCFPAAAAAVSALHRSSCAIVAGAEGAAEEARAVAAAEATVQLQQLQQTRSTAQAARQHRQRQQQAHSAGHTQLVVSAATSSGSSSVSVAAGGQQQQQLILVTSSSAAIAAAAAAGRESSPEPILVTYGAVQAVFRGVRWCEQRQRWHATIDARTWESFYSTHALSMPVLTHYSGFPRYWCCE